MSETTEVEIQIDEKTIEQEAECILFEVFLESNLNQVLKEIDFTDPEYKQNKEFSECPATEHKK